MSLNNKDSNPQGNVANTSYDGDAMVCEEATTTSKRFVEVLLLD